MTTALDRVKLKIDTPFSILSHKLNKYLFGKKKADQIKWLKQVKKLKKKYFKGTFWNFNGVLLPDYKPEPIGWLIWSIYMDTLFTYCVHGDNYSHTLIDKLDPFLPEGTYGYSNDEIDVTIKAGDIVIDAGAWIGDFSAYAVKKGASVYAFEPCAETCGYLRKTRELNGNIVVQQKGLGAKNEIRYITNDTNNSGSNRITNKKKSNEVIEIITLDTFVKENRIDKINFIKADIEGFERFLIKGAKNVLKKHSPKLAICTYHLNDDPTVISELIKEANPDYKIVHKRKKLYAAVPKVSVNM